MNELNLRLKLAEIGVMKEGRSEYIVRKMQETRNFEVDLKAKNKWKDWVMGLEKERWESVEKELKIIFKEMKEQSDKQFNTDIAFAVGNQAQQKNRDEIKRETG